MINSRAISASMASMLFLIGCAPAGPEVHSVTGKVTVGGKPAADVGVTFAPVDGKPASSGRTNASGAFVLMTQSGKAGAVAGKHKVLLTPPSTSNTSANFGDPAAIAKMVEQRSMQEKSGKRGMLNTKGDAASGAVVIPDEYGNPQKTPLPEYEVKPGVANNFDVPLP